MLIPLMALYVLLQIALMLCAWRRTAPIAYGKALIFALLALAAVWTLLINDSPRVIALAPFKYAVVLFNLVPLLFAGAVALMTAIRPKALSRAIVFSALLLSVDFYFWGGAFYTPFKSIDRWNGVCCLQSTEYTCGAAAAATLLKVHGINTNEAEMIPLCLTGFRGTSYWAQYHGLSVQAGAHGMRAVVSDASFDAFLARNEPALIGVMLTPELDAKDKRYSDKWHWSVNVAHAVVFLGTSGDGHVLIADPSFGLERWRSEALRDLWRNRAMYLE